MSVSGDVAHVSPLCEINERWGPGSALAGRAGDPQAERMLENLLPRRKLHLRQPRPWRVAPFLCTWGMARLGAVGEGTEARKGHVPLARMGRGSLEEKFLPQERVHHHPASTYPTPWLNLTFPVFFLFPILAAVRSPADRLLGSQLGDLELVP